MAGYYKYYKYSKYSYKFIYLNFSYSEICNVQAIHRDLKPENILFKVKINNIYF